MSVEIAESQRKHGEAMYAIGIKHAVEMFKLLGEDAIPKLEEMIKEYERKS